MNGREYFHESVVKDIVDILTDLKDFDEVQFINNANAKRSFKSITSATKDLILTFPVLVSTDLDPENAIMIAKAQEKKMASLLHILFTAISVGNNEDVYDYVRKFHSNVGSMNGTLDDYIDSFDRAAATFGESYNKTLEIDHAVLETVLEELKESNYTLPDNVNESSLEAFKIAPGYRTGLNDMIIKEAKTNVYNTHHHHAAAAPTNDADVTQHMMSQIGQHPDQADNIKSMYNRYMEYKQSQVDAKSNGSVSISRLNDQKSANDAAKAFSDITKAHNAVVLNNEYKKANELQPTMMVINFMKKNDTTATINTAVIGIKCKIYPVTSSDIVNRISGKLQDRSVLTNFVRATTNEIAFFRDFLFAVDNAKLDAKSYGKAATSNKLWKVLERRSTKSKFRRSLKMYNDATAITTLVLSENDAEYLKTNYSIDILDVSRARKIMDSYNFMCLVVANQSTEVASFLYDTGDDTYEMIPFSGLEREASDNSYKKMVNLLAKVSR